MRAVGDELKDWKLKLGGNLACMDAIATGMLLGVAIAFLITTSSN